VIVQVKENQPTLLADCKFTYENLKPDDVFIAPIENGRNRIEKRTTLVFRNLFTTDPDWELARELIVSRRIRSVFSTKEKQWHSTEEIAFHISTTTLSAKEYAHGIRVHWGTENKNHHVKDVTMTEDASRIRKNPGNFARMRSYALNILRINSVKNISSTLYENALDLSVPLNYLGVL